MLALNRGRVQGGEGGFKARTSARAVRWGEDLALTTIIREAHPGDSVRELSRRSRQPLSIPDTAASHLVQSHSKVATTHL